MIAVLVFGAERAGDREKEAGHHRDVAWLAPRLFIPASLSAMILGILLVIDGPWSFDQLWISLALAGWAASFLGDDGGTLIMGAAILAVAILLAAVSIRGQQAATQQPAS